MSKRGNTHIKKLVPEIKVMIPEGKTGVNRNACKRIRFRIKSTWLYGYVILCFFAVSIAFCFICAKMINVIIW